jgi:decaprenylphospho-beta-D-ribofuranose 2-oxidase
VSDRLLTGWGRTAPTRADVVTVNDHEQVSDLLASAPARGVLARGLGRSYGDAAQNAGGRVLDLSRLTLRGSAQRVLVHPASGVARCAAGVDLDELIREALPCGWFPAVTPGTRWVTVAGAVAADVHGKNHHADGSIGAFVRSLRLTTPSHGEMHVSPRDNADVFWATVGGMGLTGVISEVELQLTRVATPTVQVDTDRCDALDDLVDTVSAHEGQRRYCVAWVDVLSRHGRGVVTSADHTEADTQSSTASLHVPRPRLAVPPHVPAGLLRRSSVQAFNEAWYRRSPRHVRDVPQTLWRFFYPLDGVGDWNRLYGPSGLVQYQVVVPGPDSIGTLLALLRRHRAPVFLAVVKTFGGAGSAPLSFPRPGWTLAVDLPRDTPGLEALLDQLDNVTVDAGGRTYLAKDSRTRPELIASMYPRLDAWRAVRDAVDPERVMTSDLSRRLLL